jgi:hypothetical protein
LLYFEDFLTGAGEFTVKEIEAFEIADYTPLPTDVKKSRIVGRSDIERFLRPTIFTALSEFQCAVKANCDER